MSEISQSKRAAIGMNKITTQVWIFDYSLTVRAHIEIQEVFESGIFFANLAIKSMHNSLNFKFKLWKTTFRSRVQQIHNIYLDKNTKDSQPITFTFCCCYWWILAIVMDKMKLQKRNDQNEQKKKKQTLKS